MTKVQDDLKAHEAFNLHSLLDNQFTAGDFSTFNIVYNVYDGEPINIGGTPPLPNVRQASLPTNSDETRPGNSQSASQAPTGDAKMEVDSNSNPNSSIHSSASNEGSSQEKTVKDFLKACFPTDKNTRTKIEPQIQTMFTDHSGMFEAFRTLI